MKQAHIQQLRKILAVEITALHEEKHCLKHMVDTYWKLCDPIAIGSNYFYLLNKYKTSFRDITKQIAIKASLVKELKKEEKRIRGISSMD